MSKRIECKEWGKVLTPSGYWNNSLWELYGHTVSFPKKILDDSVISEVKVKTWTAADSYQ